jgi:hypothetical protein
MRRFTEMPEQSLRRHERLIVRAFRYLANPASILVAIGRRLPFGSFQLRCALDLHPRPHYAFGVQQAATLASRLGVPAITVIEFGVAGGQGLVELERFAERTTEATGVDIQVYGFDRGSGLPEPDGYRDLPYTWERGDFNMDVTALRARLTSARLVLGDIEDTVPTFLDERRPPIGFVAVDVDYYSSTVAALQIFRGENECFLPRVFCYFDDTIGDDDQTIHNEYVGELAAIAEFNDRHADMKLARINGLTHKRAVPAPWHDAVFVLHRFDHPDYGQNVGKPAEARQLPI